MKKFKLAITVDDLPVHGPLPKQFDHEEIMMRILATLKKFSIENVYGFTNGCHLSENPKADKILKGWVAAGHRLGNHTFSHPDLRNISANDFCLDIKKNEGVLQKYDDSKIKYFRYPFLLEGENEVKRNAVRSFLKENNYTIASCTIDYRDFYWNEAIALSLSLEDYSLIDSMKKGYVESAIYRVKLAQLLSERLFSRDISHTLLIHAGISSALYLEDVLSAFSAAGCEFIFLQDAINNDDVYHTDTKFVSTMGRNLIAQYAEVRKLEKIPFPPLPVTFESLDQLVCDLKMRLNHGQ